LNHYEELRGLLQRYARAVDERDLEALECLFHPEAEIIGTRGALGLEAWLDTMRAPRTFPQSMHVIGVPVIDLDSDEDAAGLDTYAVVHQLGDTASGQGDLTLGIRYRDRAVVHQGRWVFLRRDSHTLWMR
jgi:hypothetical protein